VVASGSAFQGARYPEARLDTIHDNGFVPCPASLVPNADAARAFLRLVLLSILQCFCSPRSQPRGVRRVLATVHRLGTSAIRRRLMGTEVA
jgi:hypothetical protein